MNEQNEVVVNEAAAQFNALKKDVKRAADWEGRLQAVKALGALQTEEAMKVLFYVAKAENVTKVREAAAAILKANGENVPNYEKPKYGFFKDMRKVFLRIKKSLPKDHTYEDFKAKLEKMRSDIYNTYEGEMGANFDAWLKDMWETTVPQK